MKKTNAVILAGLAALAVLTYAPLFHQPLLQDDYPNIEQAREFGAHWSAAFEHPVFRFRLTSYALFYAADRLFGCSAPALYAVSIGLHIIATWLVFALGTWSAIGWRVAAFAAAFFAVYEGHQEAVMWYSATNESLMFVFGVAALLMWIRFLDGGTKWWYAGALAAFALALVSKESAVVFVPLVLAVAWPLDRRRICLWLPFAALAAAEVMALASTRSYSFRFQDGSFLLSAPFWITWPASYFRLLWAWGFAFLIVLAFAKWRRNARVVVLGAVWIAIGLIPYSFVTYMHRVPSRQTYLASLGLALIAGAALDLIATRSRILTAAVLAFVCVQNAGCIWTRKRAQFLERAAPTEALVEKVKASSGPVYVRCYPSPPIVAEAAIRLRTGKPASVLVWNAADAAKQGAEDFCWTR